MRATGVTRCTISTDSPRPTSASRRLNPFVASVTLTFFIGLFRPDYTSRSTLTNLRVRRGLYAVIPPGADPGSYPVDPCLVAAKLTPDAVLSHHTALEFHGRAYSVWSHLIYSASRPVGPLTFRSQVFRGAKFPEALLRSGTKHFGVLTSERSGVAVRVTSLERTLVDVLHRPDLSGGWEEIWRSLESVEFFNVDQVVEYALLLGNATTAAKVGLFFD